MSMSIGSGGKSGLCVGALALLACLPAAGWRANAAIVAVDPQGPAMVKATALSFEGKSKLDLSSLSGPDLDLGFNDYLEFRLSIPAGAKGGAQVSWGTSASPGFSDKRKVVIPETQAPADGKARVYRLDMGTEPKWYGSLRDLRITPAAEGAGIVLDEVRIGDQAGEVYEGRDYRDLPKSKYELDSKHFRFVWNETRAKEGINETKARGALRNAEKCWAFYTKILKYREPSKGEDPNRKYKVTFTCNSPGYFAGGWLNIDPTGLQADPPTWVIPHEFMHVCQGCQGGRLDGPWFESHANFVREQWLYWLAEDYPDTSNLETGFVQMSYLYPSHGLFYYLCWPIFLYLDENPDSLPGLGVGTVARLWQETNESDQGVVFNTIARVAPQVSVKDLLGYYARRGATFNYSHKTAMRKNLKWTTVDRIGLNNDDRPYFAELKQRADDPSWWQVPPHLAPMQGAYTISELVVPKGTGERKVTVNFRGLPHGSRGADWRASLVVVADDYSERYSKLWNAGEMTVTLAPNENKLFLAVAGTPDKMLYGGQSDKAYPYQSHPQRERFLYEIQVTGATPREYKPVTRGEGRKHPNGGGFVAATAQVDASVYVGPNAVVLDRAEVRGNARIEDFAAVSGQARVLDNAIVSGHALVRGMAVVKGDAKVRDYALVEENAGRRGAASPTTITCTIEAHARILQNANVREKGHVTDYATMKGISAAWKFDEGTLIGGLIGGDAVLDGDGQYGRTITNGFQFGFQPWNHGPMEWIESRHAPERLYAAYEFSRMHESLAKDLYGATDGYLAGNPAWVEKDEKRMGFLTFNGKDQYVLLDRSVSDLAEMTVSVWFKPESLGRRPFLLLFGSGVKRPVFCFGADANKRMVLELNGGKPKLILKDGRKSEKLVSNLKIAAGEWTQLAVTLDGRTGALYVNGKEAARAAITIRPDQLMAPNTNTGRQRNYIARDVGKGRFQGAMDDFRVYTKAFGADRIPALAEEIGIVSGGLKGEYFADKELKDLKTTRIDPTLDFEWANDPPAEDVPGNDFSVRWTGQVQPRFSETYTFILGARTGRRMWVKGQMLVDKWTVEEQPGSRERGRRPVEDSGTITLETGRKYDIKVEMCKSGRRGLCRLLWSSPSQPRQIVPAESLTPAK